VIKFLTTISNIVALVLKVLDYLKVSRARQDGRNEARQEIQKQEQEHVKQADKVLAESRTPSAAADRLRNGTF